MKTVFPERSRVDCILVWGHGLPYLTDILKDIRLQKPFKILKIQKYRPKNMKDFVREMYSHDYAPFWHLKEKTKYLLNTRKEVCFVFIKNFLPNEDYLDKGQFRHKESLTLKAFKEQLRDSYNPQENGERSHNHVIHATDSQEQTEKILKYLGYKNGLKHLKSTRQSVDFPYYIQDCKEFELKLIGIDKIYCNIVQGDGWDSFSLVTVHIVDSPQYLGISQDIDIYRQYVNKYLGGALQVDYSIDRYRDMYKDFSYLRAPYQNSFVIVQKKDDRYIILDGLHRVCSHVYQGNKEIKVCQVLK